MPSAIGAVAVSAAPQAGSVIGNQAIATYTNDAGDTITVTSNTVETIVQQVAGVTLTSDNTETIAPGGKAFLPHIITNEGNGPDSFTLTAVENNVGTLDTSQLVFYPDTNMDGVADSATPLTNTPTLAAGEQFGVVIEATVPSSATGSDTIAITAISALDGGITSANTDTLTISNDAIVELVKSMVADAASGGNPSIVDAGDTVTIKLTYSSTGLTAANNYVVQDVLDGRLTYVPNSATWSDATGALDESNGSTVVDKTNGSGETIAYAYDNSQTINAGTITNIATQEVDSVTFPPSNTASVVVDDQYRVEIADTAINADNSVNGTVVSTTDDDGLNDDIVTESQSVGQGGSIKHEFVLTNLSNQTDSFTLQVDNVNYPLGTTFRFVGADGVTPIVGSVGPLAVDDSSKITLIATLPTDVSPTGAADYTATVTTVSDGSGVSDASTAKFDGAVLPSSVDLENAVVGAEGDGLAPTAAGGAPWVTSATDPGTPVVFDMLVQNQGPVSDSYNLSLAQALPAGWTVEFRADDGSVISNTGTIPAGTSRTFTAVITPTADALPGDTNVEIALASAVSGQGDSIVNRVTVNEVYDAEIIESQSAQASPGGIVDMLHTITNNGNVAITEASILQSGLTNFSGAVFWDENKNGIIDPSEIVIDNFNDLTNGVSAGVNGLAPGDTISVIYRVQSPSTSTSGVTENGTITIGNALNAGAATDSDLTNNSVEDRITIVSGDMTLVKYQYVDPDCDGFVGTFTKTRQDVEPGQCIRYQVVAENTGAAPATDVTILDAAPAYTTVTNCGGACNETLFPTTSTATISSGNVSSDHGSVLPGGFARLEFTVQVDN